jgi:osmotically-inducible protein OsmY
MRSFPPFAIALLLITACSLNPQSSADSEVTEQIKTALHADQLDGVDVRVSHGAVTLSGIVSSELEREVAQREAERVDGVRAVANRIEIRPGH